MSASKSYPRWLHPNMTLDGSKRLVQNAVEEEMYTGVEMKEDGTPKYAVPPTKEMIAERGYSPEAVEKIFAMERDKAAAREYPYGPNEPGGAPIAPVGDFASMQKMIDEAAAQQAAVLSVYDPSLGQAATTNLDQPKQETAEKQAEQPVDHEAVADALGLNG